jgi:CRISPR-associated protein Cas1
MGDRIIEIATDGRHLAVHHGFMTVSADGAEIARLPLDDIAAIIACAHGLSYSNNLLVELARRNTQLILCAANFTPVAFLWAVDGYHQQAARMDAQMEATRPKSKVIWKQLVKAKIAQQGAVLAAIGQAAPPFSALVAKVKSGDPENIEAQAARRYWPLLFGADFRRDRETPGVNAMLNYGYIIIRSAVARALLGAGLHPTFGVHHKNANNPMRLVDDVMEPFRPYVDFAVWHMVKTGSETITPDVKRTLAGLLEMEVTTVGGMTALRTAIQNTAISLAQVYEGVRDELDLPLTNPPLWQAAAL